MQNTVRHITKSLLVPLTRKEREDEVVKLTDSLTAISELEGEIETLKSSW